MTQKWLILLEALPGFTWWGGFAVTIIIGIISYFFKKDQKAQEVRIENLEKLVEKYDDKNQKKHEEYEKKHEALHHADSVINDKIHGVKEVVLGEINAISIKIAEFRNDFKK